MKRLIEGLFLVVVVLLIIFALVYVFLSFQGKAIIINQLEEATHKKVTVGEFRLTPPLNIRLNGLKIEGLADIEYIYVSPSILGFFTGNIVLNKIEVTNPQLILERGLPEQVAQSNAPIPPIPETTAKVQLPLKENVANPFPVIFRRLVIKNGKVNIIDYTVGQPGIKLTIKDINFALNNVFVFGRAMISSFDLKGKIPWQEGQEEGKIEAEGWVNFGKRDMQATFKVSDIDGVYLYPYYAQWVDLEKARIQKAKLNFSSNIHGLDNDLTAECHLELTDIVRKPRTSEENREKAEQIADAVIEIFKALDQGKIVLNFTIRTKMDSPQFNFGNIRMAFENKIAQGRPGISITPQAVFRLPGKLLEGGIRGATDFTKSVIDGTFAIGQELKKSVEETFIRPAGGRKAK